MTARLGYDIHGPSGDVEDVPVLVLGSSLGTDRRMWDPQLADLARRFRVVRYDHRGHGTSDVPEGPYSIDDLAGDVLALLDQLGIGRFSLGGSALGGMVAMRIAAYRPDRVERLALFCTSAHLPPAEGWADRAAVARGHGTEALSQAIPSRWFTTAFAAANPETVQRCRDLLLATPDEGYAGCCEAIGDMDLRPLLSAIVAPTLVVAGNYDPAMPEAHARTIAAGINAVRADSGGGSTAGSCRVEVVDGANLATVENPSVCTALMIEHLTTAS